MKTKEDRKNKIIGDSISLMYLNGYNGTSVKDITDAAGIPKGSFYNYFDGKEQYAIDAVKYYTDINHEGFTLLKSNELKPLDRIKSFFNAKRQRAQQKGLKFGCFVGNLSEEVGGVNPAIAEAAAEFHENLRMLISRNLEEAKQSDELKTNLDVNVLSGFIVSSWQGALLRAKVADDKSVLDDFCMVLEKELL